MLKVFSEKKIYQRFLTKLLVYMLQINFHDLINIIDPTGKLCYYLKISSSTNIFAKLIQAYATLTPYSCGLKRAFPTPRYIKDLSF